MSNPHLSYCLFKNVSHYGLRKSNGFFVPSSYIRFHSKYIYFVLFPIFYFCLPQVYVLFKIRFILDKVLFIKVSLFNQFIISPLAILNLLMASLLSFVFSLYPQCKCFACFYNFCRLSVLPPSMYYILNWCC